jgi:hypothetical protein
MYLLTTITILLLTLPVQALPVTYLCKKLQTGNVSGQAQLNAKSIDLEVAIDLENKKAEISGHIMTKQSKFYAEDQVVWTRSYFPNAKFNQENNLLRIESFTRSILMCGPGSGTGPCREWISLSIDLQTKEIIFEEKYSYERFTGKVLEDKSIKMKCEI